jgi:hypothetical protein
LLYYKDTANQTVELTKDSPYSPDLTLSDFRMFGPMKGALRGRRFSSIEEVARIHSCVCVCELVRLRASLCCVILYKYRPNPCHFSFSNPRSPTRFHGFISSELFQNWNKSVGLMHESGTQGSRKKARSLTHSLSIGKITDADSDKIFKVGLVTLRI